MLVLAWALAVTGLPDCLSITGGALVIPANVTEIPDNKYEGCYEITSLTFEANSNLTTIGEKAFKDTKIAGALEIPANVEIIKKQAFLDTDISSLTFEANSNLNTIGKETFHIPTLVGALEIPANVVTIEEDAFYETAITSLTFASGSKLETIGVQSFGECQQLTGPIQIPANVVTIKNDAFYNTAITGLTFEINSGLETIEDSAFESAESLTGPVVIPSSVTTIGLQSFRKTAITSIDFPESVASFGYSVFKECLNLSRVIVRGNLSLDSDNLDRLILSLCDNSNNQICVEGNGTGAAAIFDNFNYQSYGDCELAACTPTPSPTANPTAQPTYDNSPVPPPETKNGGTWVMLGPMLGFLGVSIGFSLYLLV
jgi:hypothetical protein